MKDRALDISTVELKRRRTRIVATLGPASSSDDAIARLIDCGVDVFRLNFSHGTHEGHRENYHRIRKAAAAKGKHTAILADLCGPKIRVGLFEGDGIVLTTGETVTVTTRDVKGRPGLIPSQYQALAGDVKPGDRILLDDGKLELQVLKEEGDTEIECKVVQGGKLSNKKGMNLPGVAVSAPSLTEKDKADAVFAAGLGVDFMALSFVRRASDVLELRAVLDAERSTAHIIAKIEKPEALEEIGPILDAVDGIMVARGDLGVEMPPEIVPIIQQELIRRCIEANKPVIVATQMLESMIENARPTRAEVTDVAMAATSRADAVMLSAETAAGKFPFEAVATMDRVLRLVEGYQWKRGLHGMGAEHRPRRPGDPLEPGEALSRATSLLSGDLQVRAIAVPTRSGRTARLVSAERPAAPIVVLTDDEGMCRRLSLLWGVLTVHTLSAELTAPQSVAIMAVRRFGMAEAGQPVLLVWDPSRDKAKAQPTVSILQA